MIELWRQDPTPLPKNLEVDQDREHLKLLNIYKFVILHGAGYTLMGVNIKKTVNFLVCHYEHFFVEKLLKPCGFWIYKNTI